MKIESFDIVKHPTITHNSKVIMKNGIKFLAIIDENEKHYPQYTEWGLKQVDYRVTPQQPSTNHKIIMNLFIHENNKGFEYFIELDDKHIKLLLKGELSPYFLIIDPDYNLRFGLDFSTLTNFPKELDIMLRIKTGVSIIKKLMENE